MMLHNNLKGEKILNKTHKIFDIVISICIVLAMLCSCGFDAQDDEELIAECIECFVEAYNDRDIETILECMDSKMRDTFGYAADITDGIASKIGLDVGLSEILGISASFALEDDFIAINDMDITVNENGRAKADVYIGAEFADSEDETYEKIRFIMVEEDTDWFIHDIQIK